MLYTSPLPSVEIPLVPITEFVLRRVEDHPDRPALIDGASGRTYSFAELSDVIHSVCRYVGMTNNITWLLANPTAKKHATRVKTYGCPRSARNHFAAGANCCCKKV